MLFFFMKQLLEFTGLARHYQVTGCDARRLETSSSAFDPSGNLLEPRRFECYADIHITCMDDPNAVHSVGGLKNRLVSPKQRMLAKDELPDQLVCTIDMMKKFDFNAAAGIGFVTDLFYLCVGLHDEEYSSYLSDITMVVFSLRGIMFITIL
jgi:hypothetical protein